MERWVGTVLLMSLFIRGFASGDSGPAGGPSAGMGGITVFGSDVWSAFNNPAGLGDLQRWSAGVFGENRFLLQELTTGSAGLVLPFRKGGLGLGVRYFGTSLYHETSVGLSCALRLAKRFFAGIRIDYMNAHTGEGYGSVHSLQAEAGARYDISDRLRIGLYLINPVAIPLNNNPPERLPSIYRLGLEWQPLPSLTAQLEAEKATLLPLTLRGGLGYRLASPFLLRLGFRSSPTLFTFGAEMTFRRMVISAGTAYDLRLGFSPWIGIEISEK